MGVPGAGRGREWVPVLYGMNSLSCVDRGRVGGSPGTANPLLFIRPLQLHSTLRSVCVCPVRSSLITLRLLYYLLMLPLEFGHGGLLVFPVLINAAGHVVEHGMRFLCAWLVMVGDDAQMTLYAGLYGSLRRSWPSSPISSLICWSSSSCDSFARCCAAAIFCTRMASRASS